MRRVCMERGGCHHAVHRITLGSSVLVVVYIPTIEQVVFLKNDGTLLLLQTTKDMALLCALENTARYTCAGASMHTSQNGMAETYDSSVAKTNPDSSRRSPKATALETAPLLHVSCQEHRIRTS